MHLHELARSTPGFIRTYSQKQMLVDFLGFRDTVAFCSRNGLPVDSAIIATGAGARKFMEAVSAARDEMTDSKFEKVKRNRL